VGTIKTNKIRKNLHLEELGNAKRLKQKDPQKREIELN